MLQFYVYNNFSFETLAGTILRMLVGLLYLKVEGKEFVPKYVKTMYFICLLSMIAYLLLNVFPSFYEYLNQNAFENLSEWDSTRSIFIYQFSPNNPVERNIGPFWEPGVFGIFISISIFFKLFILKEKLYRSLLEITSIVTTFSTTSYLILFLLLTLYFAFYFRYIIKIILLPVYVTLFIFIFVNSDFLNYKVTTQLDEVQITKRDSEEGRFVSIIRDYEDIKKSWVTGTGFYSPNRFYFSPWRTNSNCGFTDMVVKLGLIGSILYFILLYRGTCKIIKYYTNRGVLLLNIILLLAIFLASISEIVYSMSIFLGIAILGSSKQTSYSLLPRRKVYFKKWRPSISQFQKFKELKTG